MSVSTNRKKSKFLIDMKTRNKGVLIKKQVESVDIKSRGLGFEPDTSFPNMDSTTNDIVSNFYWTQKPYQSGLS